MVPTYHPTYLIHAVHLPGGPDMPPLRSPARLSWCIWRELYVQVDTHVFFWILNESGQCMTFHRHHTVVFLGTKLESAVPVYVGCVGRHPSLADGVL